MAIDTKELRTRAEDNIAQGMGHWAFAKSTDVLRLLDALDAQTAELEALWAKVEPFLQHTQLCGKTFWGRGAGICNCGLDALLAARKEK